MKKFFYMLIAVAVLVPGMALAQMYYTYPTRGYVVTRTSSETLRQDRIAIQDARAQLAFSQNRLERDRINGRWWRISADVARVNHDRMQLRLALDTYSQDRNAFVGYRYGVPSRTYHYYTPY